MQSNVAAGNAGQGTTSAGRWENTVAVYNSRQAANFFIRKSLATGTRLTVLGMSFIVLRGHFQIAGEENQEDS